MSDKETSLMLTDFSFAVPDELIAQKPLQQRDDSRLLIWDGQTISHSFVRQLCDAVPKGTLFILNDSRVIASRLHGNLKTGGAIELLLLEPYQVGQAESWLSLGKPMRKLAVGTKIYFEDGLTAEVLDLGRPSAAGPQPFEVRLNLTGSKLLNWLDQFGEMPLPPYITRKNPSADTKTLDRSRYQTVYAQDSGSVAAPTAGLHFTESVLSSLMQRECTFANVTLHVGAGTFLPVKTSNPASHVMHSERFLVPKQTLSAISQARREGRKVITVGTTALRSLEGLCREAERQSIEPMDLTNEWLRTDIFIRPEFKSSRHQPKLCDGIMTNFHQPESTLFMLICALIGFERARALYQEAISHQYRFFSYGDSSLLWLH
jgi:S-adenosylmethionine:tRNA ribosyltransferase-isomerase